MKIDFEKLIQTVPMIQMNQITDNTVYGLMEKYNVCGSVKVKTVYWIIKDAYEKGLLNSENIILEASSGNTGIALAYLSNIFGYKVQIVLPVSTAINKKRLIREYGGQIIEIDGTTDSCIVERDKIFAENPSAYYIPDQFSNYANVDAHYNLTGPYILKRIPDIDFFIAGLGTSGTLIGTAKYLKEHKPNVKIIAVNPIEKIEGMRNYKTSKIVVPFYEEYKHLIDEIIDVTYEDSISGIQKLAEEKNYVGLSAGAIFSGTLQYLNQKKGLTGVFVAPDGIDFYLENTLDSLKMNRRSTTNRLNGCFMA